MNTYNMFSWRNKTNISLKWVPTTHVFVKKQDKYFPEMSTPNVCFREETRQIFPGNEYTQRVFSWRNNTNISLKWVPTTNVFVTKRDKYFLVMSTYETCFHEETRQIFPWNEYLRHMFSWRNKTNISLKWVHQRVFSWRNKTNISLKWVLTAYVFVKKQDKYFPDTLLI